MVKIAKINSKDQITLPKDLVDKYNLCCVETVVFSDSGEGIITRHVMVPREAC